MEPAPRRVAVLGAGSWGTALAALAARNGHATVLWGRDAEALREMQRTHHNRRYLPDLALPASLRFEADLQAALDGAHVVIVVVPSHAFSDLLREIAPLLPPGAGVAWATKGFVPGSGRFLHEAADDILGPQVPTAAITGPSFALEVAQGLPTAITVHSRQPQFAQDVAQTLHANTFRAYTGSDMIGAGLGGAMKNVLAVATGLADGMGLGLNARAGLITRGLNEMLRLNSALGGRAETLMGLAGLGDLVLTCTGDLSRNRRLGLALGRGQSLREAVAQIGQVVESVQTVDELMRLAEQHHMDVPITALVHAVLHEKITPQHGLKLLLSREQKPEFVD